MTKTINKKENSNKNNSKNNIKTEQKKNINSNKNTQKKQQPKKKNTNNKKSNKPTNKKKLNEISKEIKTTVTQKKDDNKKKENVNLNNNTSKNKQENKSNKKINNIKTEQKENDNLNKNNSKKNNNTSKKKQSKKTNKKTNNQKSKQQKNKKIVKETLKEKVIKEVKIEQEETIKIDEIIEKIKIETSKEIKDDSKKEDESKAIEETTNNLKEDIILEQEETIKIDEIIKEIEIKSLEEIKENSKKEEFEKIKESNVEIITTDNLNKKRKRRNRKNFLILLLLLTLSLLVINVIKYIEITKNEEIEKINHKLKEELKKEITLHYNNYVITNKESKIYKLNDEKYEEVGIIANNQELTLDNLEISSETTYFKIIDFDNEYYIYYKDVDKVESLKEIDNRYKKYIVFNKNIITKDITNFYDEENNLIYKISSSYNLPIIINEEERYGIEFNNRLLYVKNEDVEKIENRQNTNQKNTDGVAVLNYHFFYDETKESERQDCNQIICHPKGLVEKHAKYFKDNNIFTPTMNEFEMYLDKKINLPKSVLITIDDGWRTAIGEEIFERNEVNATIFLITSWFEEITFIDQYNYIEYHSHGDKLHDPGVCSGGQGGAIKCLEKNKLLADLKLSREKLNGTTAFCYPFYEYNQYSINTLKEAGFTMAFRGGFKKASPGVNKYEIPRYVVYNDTSVSEIASYIN